MLDLEQGRNSHICVHDRVAQMSFIVYVTKATNTFLLLLTKHSSSACSLGIGLEMMLLLHNLP
jgi:hypothetical protein